MLPVVSGTEGPVSGDIFMALLPSSSLFNDHFLTPRTLSTVFYCDKHFFVDFRKLLIHAVSCYFGLCCVTLAINSNGDSIFACPLRGYWSVS